MAKRNIGLDLLKIYATFLVVLLHVSGFTLLLKGEENYSVPVFCVYLIMEAIAYPAIHLFVMIGSWFMIEKCSPIKRIVNIWSQTWIVTIFGMTAYVLILHKFPYWGGIVYIPIYRKGLLVCNRIYNSDYACAVS